ncbi:MAG: peptide chain release factor N(5)-glutamine methyltransferase [Limnochordales bacterium]|nr:peptide chain release factor N(5)-glutamine methyltransferase [Limnochordales bacterium]
MAGGEISGLGGESVGKSRGGGKAATAKLPTVLELIRLSTQYLSQCGVATPRLDAEVLLADLLGLTRLDLYVQFDRPLVSAEVDEYRRRIVARGRRVPVALIIGKKEFFGLELLVRPGVLIPRPETEVVVEEALRLLGAAEGRPGPARLEIADIGSGTGAIGLALASRLPQARIWAIDLSPVAREVTAENARRLGLAEQVKVLAGDWLRDPDTGQPLKLPDLDLVVSNPPYIPTGELSGLQPEITRYEPALALDGGPDGLAAYRRMFPQVVPVLKPGGLVVVEIGAGEAAGVRQVGEAAGLQFLRVRPDLAGHERVVSFVRPAAGPARERA